MVPSKTQAITHCFMHAVQCIVSSVFSLFSAVVAVYVSGISSSEEDNSLAPQPAKKLRQTTLQF